MSASSLLLKPSLVTRAGHYAPQTHKPALCKCLGDSRTLPSEVVQWHCDDTGVCMCQLSWDWPLSLSTDWRWDLEEKLLLLCLLYGSFFTLNAENLCRGHRIPASLRRPELIFAALGIDKAFSGAKYAGYVLQLSSLYFPPASLLGLVQPISAGVLEMSTTHLYEHTRAHVHTDCEHSLCWSVGPYLWAA